MDGNLKPDTEVGTIIDKKYIKKECKSSFRRLETKAGHLITSCDSRVLQRGLKFLQHTAVTCMKST